MGNYELIAIDINFVVRKYNVGVLSEDKITAIKNGLKGHEDSFILLALVQNNLIWYYDIDENKWSVTDTKYFVDSCLYSPVFDSHVETGIIEQLYDEYSKIMSIKPPIFIPTQNYYKLINPRYKTLISNVIQNFFGIRKPQQIVDIFDSWDSGTFTEYFINKCNKKQQLEYLTSKPIILNIFTDLFTYLENGADGEYDDSLVDYLCEMCIRN